MYFTKRLISIIALLLLIAVDSNEDSNGVLVPASDPTRVTSTSCDNKQDSKASLLCSFITKRTEDSLVQPHHLIYPICLIDGDSLRDASLHIEDEYYIGEDADTAGLRLMKETSLLDNYKDFTVLSLGRQIGTAMVDSVAVWTFECTGLCVGEGRILMASDTATHEYVGFDTQSDLAIGQTQVGTLSDSLIHVLGIDSLVRKKYEEHNVPRAFLDSIGFLFKASVDFDGDNSHEYVIGTAIDTDSINVSIVAVFRLSDTAITVWQMVNRENNDSWGVGHRIVDLVDMNNDTIPEIVIKFSGYELVEYQIYKYEKGTVRNIFCGASYGC